MGATEEVVVFLQGKVFSSDRQMPEARSRRGAVVGCLHLAFHDTIDNELYFLLRLISFAALTFLGR
jgi:hypothetical protein